jgi:WhiB family transcriptional regulator, redox-sensing transcriptional regulator
MFDVTFTTPAWMDDALCAQIGGASDLWFPEKGGYNKEAHAVCERCPVRAECLQYAIDEGMHGVWGGTSDRTRNVMTGRWAS